MARQAGSSIENSFVKGLVTEASGLNFPENAVTDCDNVIFNKTGRVYRRLGFDLEVDFEYNTFGSSGVFGEFVWLTPKNNATVKFVVIQRGSVIDFFQVGESTALSAGRKAFQIALASFKVSSAPSDIQNIRAQFTTGDGRLVVAHPYCNPFTVSYNPDSDTISVKTITIKIRDFDGVDDGLDTDQRPSSLSTTHKYNLWNQGWYEKAPCSTNVASDDPGNLQPVLNYWIANRSDVPSNSDIWWVVKNASDVFVPDNGDKTALGNSPAPNGHYTFDAFNINRSSIVSGLSTSYNESAGYWRPNTVEFYQGRIFYSGVAKAPFNNKIYFSKVIEGIDDYGTCYQVNDPTSEQLSDLLETDGGVIVINEADRIIRLYSSNGILFAFANNGVWAIYGNDTFGFNAKDYQVKRISEIGCDSTSSVIEVNGAPVWWNYDGIYTLQRDVTSTQFQIQSISQDVIQTFFNEIPPSEIPYVKGAYDSVNRIVTWVYRSTETSDISTHFYYDKLLNFDLSTQAFYPWSVPFGSSGSPAYIQGIFYIYGTSFGASSETVTVGGVSVTAGGEVVTSQQSILIAQTSGMRYPVYVNGHGLTFGMFHDTSYTDYTFLGGVDYSSYFTSGYKIRGGSDRDFQTNYITVTSSVLDNSSFFLSGRWDYSLSSDTSRWTTRQQGYKDRPNYGYSTRKLKLRGNGKVLQYRVESESGKPFNIVGWSTFDTVNSMV